MDTQSTQEVDLNDFLAELSAFTKKIHFVEDDFGLDPQKNHRGISIQYVHQDELREEFLKGLIDTVTDYVYSQSKQKRILNQIKEGRTDAAAQRNLYSRAKGKFDLSDLKGDFSELLLYNLLQIYFDAVPIVRKSTITTSKNVNRFGVDNIHLAKNNDQYELYIGEAKTYDGLKAGLKKAVDDIVHKHYPNHRNELSLYQHDHFDNDQIEQIIYDYKEGDLTNIRVHLVCLVTYDIERISGSNREEILDNIIQTIEDNTDGINESKPFQRVPDEVMPLMNYILFPVQELEDLIDSFKAFI